MKFIQQLLKNKRLLIHVKDQSINCSNNIPQQKKRYPRIYRETKKAYARLFKKVFNQCIYADWNFAINRAGWFVTKIYSHFTFEQECFKKEFIFMNQRSRQNAKNPTEKDFYKLMNNSNFGYDCPNIWWTPINYIS